MSGLDYFKKVLTEDYANFRGRARRSEYWYYMLFNCILAFILGFFSPIFGDTLGFIIILIYLLVIIIPSIAVTVRRLHDMGQSGWLYFINLIPILGFIAIAILCCFDSQPGTNKWGPNPKEMGDDTMSHLVDDDLV